MNRVGSPSDDHAASRCNAIHQRRISGLGIDEFAARTAADRQIETEFVENFAEHDLSGRDVFALGNRRRQLSDFIAGVAAEIGEMELDRLARQRRGSEWVLV